MNIIFDLWGTLGNKNASFSTALSEHFSLDVKKGNYKRFEKSMQLKRWEHMEDMAVSFLHEFDVETTRRNVNFVLHAQEAVLTYATPFPGMRRTITHLKEEHKVYLLSNSTIYESVVLEKWGFAELFDELFFSFDIKALKPYKESFEKVLTKIGAKPQDCLFVDDNKHNIEAAQKLGFHVHQFTDVATFLVFLRELS